MLYFSVRPSIKRLSAADKGKLFDAILDYGEFGLIPDFQDSLAIIWDFLQPMLDADDDAYKSKCEQAKRAADTRWQGKKTDTDAYPRIRADAKHANTIQSNNNYNSISNSIATGMSMDQPPQLDENALERRRQEQIRALRNYEPGESEGDFNSV